MTTLQEPSLGQIDLIKKQVLSFLRTAQGLSEVEIQGRLDRLAMVYPFTSLVLWVAVSINDIVETGVALESWPFVCRSGLRELRVHFWMDAPYCSYLEAACFEGSKQLCGFKRLLFNQNNWVEGFQVRVYTSEPNIEAAREDFCRQVEVALPQGQSPVELHLT
jgi:hypothetical protein